jgi:hypothetical protein
MSPIRALYDFDRSDSGLISGEKIEFGLLWGQNRS